MAVFSGLMLLNFISTSISNKQKEIGILRAVGARGSDVFKIFFSEAAIICLICVALSIVLSGVGCYIFNEKITDNLKSLSSLQRLVDTDSIISMVDYLISDSARCITGESIHINAGIV